MTTAKRPWRPMTEAQKARASAVLAKVLKDRGVVEISMRLACTNQYVHKMVKTGFVPERRARDWSHYFDLSLSVLRPDLWD